jgi:hypothetical protein
MTSIFKLLSLAAAASVFYFLILVINSWQFHFDAFGKYIAPDGTMHLESTSERNFFGLLLSLILFIFTIRFGFLHQKRRKLHA